MTRRTRIFSHLAMAGLVTGLSWQAQANTIAVSADQQSMTLYTDTLDFIRSVGALGTITDAKFLSNGSVAAIINNGSTDAAYVFSGTGLIEVGNNPGWTSLSNLTALANGNVAFSYNDGGSTGVLVVDSADGSGQTFSTGGAASTLTALSNGNLAFNDGAGAVRVVDGTNANFVAGASGWTQVGAIQELDGDRIAYAVEDSGDFQVHVTNLSLGAVRSNTSLGGLATKLVDLNLSSGDIAALHSASTVHVLDDTGAALNSLGIQAGWTQVTEVLEQANGNIVFNGTDAGIPLPNFAITMDPVTGNVPSSAANSNWDEIPSQLHALSDGTVIGEFVINGGNFNHALVRLKSDFTGSDGFNQNWDDVNELAVLSNDVIIGLFEEGGLTLVATFDGTIQNLDSNAGWVDPAFLETYEGDYVLYGAGDINGALVAWDVSTGTLNNIGYVDNLGGAPSIVDHHPIPEPAAMALLGLGGVMMLSRRKRNHG